MSDTTWGSCQLFELLNVIKSGGTPDTNRSDFYGGEIPFVAIDDLTSCSKYLEHTSKHLTIEGVNGSNAWLVPTGAILYSIYATLGVVRITAIPVTTNQAILAMVVDSRRIDQRYLYQWLTSIRSLIGRYSSQTTQSNLNASIVKSFVISFPKSLAQQRRIAEILSTVDDAIEATEALIAKQQQIKQGLMHDLFTRGVWTAESIARAQQDGSPAAASAKPGQLRPPRETAPELYQESALGWIPKDWEVKLLDSIASVDRGKFTVRPRNDPRYYGGGVPFIQTGDVGANAGRKLYSYSQTLNSLGLGVSKMFPIGTVMVTIAANIGDSCILGIDSCAPDSVVGIQPNRIEDSRYIQLCIQHRKNWFMARAPQTAQKNINLEDLKPLPIPYPCVSERGLLSDLYEATDLKIYCFEQSREKLQKQKQGLMQDLLSGKVEVS